jgi:hypothetical protein
MVPMKFQFKLLTVDRIELRKEDSHEMHRLNALGSEGWHIVHVKEDPQNNRDLLLFLEREDA